MAAPDFLDQLNDIMAIVRYSIELDVAGSRKHMVDLTAASERDTGKPQTITRRIWEEVGHCPLTVGELHPFSSFIIHGLT